MMSRPDCSVCEERKAEYFGSGDHMCKKCWLSVVKQYAKMKYKPIGRTVMKE